MEIPNCYESIGDEQTRQLIYSIRKQPKLWRWAGLGRSSEHVDKIWMEISQNLKIPVETLQSHWKDLRYQFISWRNLSTEAQVSLHMRKSFKYYDSLSFLDFVLKQRSVAIPKQGSRCPRPEQPSTNDSSKFRAKPSILKKPVTTVLSKPEPSTDNCMQFSSYQAETIVRTIAGINKDLEPGHRFICNLIKEVQSHRVLWDKTYDSFNDVNLKYDAWRTIGLKLHTTTKKCQTIFGVLHQEYYRRRMKESLGERIEYSIYYKSLRFLDRYPMEHALKKTKTNSSAEPCSPKRTCSSPEPFMSSVYDPAIPSDEPIAGRPAVDFLLSSKSNFFAELPSHITDAKTSIYSDTIKIISFTPLELLKQEAGCFDKL